MKKTVLTFGLISGAILSAMMLITLPFHDAIGIRPWHVRRLYDDGARLHVVFFGVRSYRTTWPEAPCASAERSP